MLSSRAAFASLPPLSLPPPPVAIPTPPISSSLRTPSRPIPRSPYINISPQRHARIDPDTTSELESPRPSSPAVLEDVLNEQDRVGEGLLLQGELIRAVPVRNAPKFSDSQVPAKDFEVVRKLGSGSYAVVYLVREILNSASQSPPFTDDHELAFGDDLELDVPSSSFNHSAHVTYGREFAIKCLSKANLNRDALEAQLFEATIHQALPVHPNIVTLYRTLETDSVLLLVLECVPGEDLFYFLEQARDHTDEQIDVSPAACPSVTPPTPSLLSSLHPAQLLSPNRLRLIASMFAQMCDAVASCHRVSVFHRDIKPENFIVTDGTIEMPNGRKERRVIVKLTDFGLATNEPESADMDCGSAPYMSYECRNNCAPTYSTRAADVWSLGIVLINMLYHHNPWSDTTAGACPSFESFRAQPINFFMQRFTGMTREVAEFLATRVFCILEDGAESQRVTAEEFGQWIKNLPAMLAQTTAPPPPAVRSIFSPVVSTPRSRRPSRPVSLRGVGGDESRPHSRPPSQRGMLLPLSTNIEVAEPDLPELEEDDADAEVDACSRTTSTTRRRKRGARKGRGQSTAPPESDLAQDLAHASQLLAREISKSSKSPSLKSLPRASNPPTVPTPKKASKWKDLLRMNSNDSIALNVPPPVPFLLPEPSQQKRRPANTQQRDRSQPRDRDHSEHWEPSHRDRSRQREPYVPHSQSATAQNVSTLIMGLSPAPSESNSQPWARGRRREPQVSRAAQFERWGSSGSNASTFDRNASPTSIRKGYGASSNNWRSSSSASSMTTSTSSAFTRFSNGSMRSVSTVATSVSAASSWRKDTGKDSDAPVPTTNGNGKKSKPPLPAPPANVKIISGVPWELNELPRGCHVRPNDHVFAPPPLRYTLKQARAQAASLDTISERNGTNISGSGHLSHIVAKQTPYQRTDHNSSSSDVSGDSEGPSTSDSGPKKVQKGQINTLAKMLSALKANRGAH